MPPTAVDGDARKTRRSVRFYKYLLSYMFLTLTTLVMFGTAVYNGFIGTLEKEIENFNRTVLQQAMDVMDMRFKEMEAMSVQIASNPRLTAFVVNENAYEAFQAVRELASYRASNSFLYEVALYYSSARDARVFASSGTYGPEVFFGRTYGYTGWGLQDLVEAMPGMTAPVVRPMEPVRLNGVHTGEFVTCLYPLPRGWGSPYGIVIYLVERSSFIRTIENALGAYSGQFMVFDRNNRRIASISSGMADGREGGGGQESDELKLAERVGAGLLDPGSPLPGGPLGAPSSVRTVRIGKSEYAIVSARSGYNGLSYALAIPTRQFFSKVHASRNLILTAAAAVVLVGAALGLLFADRHYEPLRKLAAGLTGADGIPQPDPGLRLQGGADELSYIASTVNEIVKKNRDLTTRLTSKAGLLKQQLLLDIIKGRPMDWKERKELLASSDIYLEGLKCTVLLLSIDDYEGFRKSGDAARQELYRFSMRSLAENASEEYGSGYAADLPGDRGIALVFGMDARSEGAADGGMPERAILESLAARVRELLGSYFELSFTIGIGGSRVEIPGIYTSYTEASRAVLHRTRLGNGRTIFYADIAGEQEKIYRYPSALEGKLLRSIREGDDEGIGNAVESVVRDIAEQHLLPEAEQCICFGVLNSILRTLSELSIEADAAFQEDFEHILLARYEDLSGLESRMASLGRNASRLVSRLRERKKVDRLDRIIEYVHASFDRYTLTLEEIADHFSLSPSYMTTFFKEHTGSSLMSYIDKLRMRKVKELLETTELTQREIMQRVGYFDQTNFIRKFRSAEGVTPAVFRDMVRGSMRQKR